MFVELLVARWGMGRVGRTLARVGVAGAMSLAVACSGSPSVPIGDGGLVDATADVTAESGGSRPDTGGHDARHGDTGAGGDATSHPDAGSDSGSADVVTTTDSGIDARESGADAGHDAVSDGPVPPECTDSGECAGPTTDCRHPSCVSGTCTTVFVAANTPTASNPPQTPGDCKQIVCDGNGGTTTIADDNDPAMSATVCITDGCSNGAATQTIHAGTVCGGTAMMPELCSAAGACGCMSDTDCTPPDTCGGGDPGTPLYCGCTKTTCAGEMATCGTIPDGCISTLNCNDGQKDGTETDVDCGGGDANGSTCAATCGPGKKCLSGTDCGSGSCVDGVCCNSACAGPCMACSAAKKGQGIDGVCGAVKVGSDPDGDCPVSGQASCGNSGGCNGTGACTEWAAGTVYVPSSCMGATTLVLPDKCNGTGTCALPMMTTQDCTPYKCGGSPAACTTSCTFDTDCASSAYYCNNHQCVAKVADGATCSAADQCKTGFCVDGYCCDGTCAGTCMACSAAKKGQGANGTCGPILNGTDPDDECPAASQASCGNSGGCNGVGACSEWPTGTVCVPSSCKNLTTLMVDETCATGTCVAPMMTTQDCTPYQCGGAPAVCTTSCLFDTDCASSAYYCNASVCSPKASPGGACSTANECLLGFCVDGYCCNTACNTGDCVACANLLTNAPNGTCTNVVMGDGHGACMACDGNGACLP